MLATFLTTKKPFYRRGTSLVEMVLYVVLLTFVVGIIVQMLITIGGVYRNIKLTRELESSGTIALETMLREIRNASNVEAGESDLNVNPGFLVISGTDENLNPYKIKFNVVSGALQVSKNNESPTALTSSSGVIDHLLFSRVATSTSEGVRIEMEITGTAGPVSKSEWFYGFAVLRGSY
jgi:hypothetical protein